MNIISLKVFSLLLFTTCCLFTTNLAFAEAKVPYDVSTELQVIHLNNSTVEQLVTLKGIGQKKAEAIVSYREKVGDFTSVADLMKVKGIGEKVIKDNKSRLII